MGGSSVIGVQFFSIMSVAYFTSRYAVTKWIVNNFVTYKICKLTYLPHPGTCELVPKL